MAGFFSLAPGAPEPHAQRALIEPILLNKKLVEGDIWYSVVADWLQQWKRHVNLIPLRKYYHNRLPPGPVETCKEFGHSIELIHEDAWKLFKSWFGISTGHNTLRHVVYGFSAAPEIELNLNYFHVTMTTTRKEHVLRFSKAEKIGYIEYRARQAFEVGATANTRLWGKLIESDSAWKLLSARTLSVGKALEMDSDFIRPELCLEVHGVDDVWTNPPNHAPSNQLQESPSGRLYECSIFDDVTATWEVDIQDQIDVIGKGFVDKLHTTFGSFVVKAKNYISEREARLRETEKLVAGEHERLHQQSARLEEREKRLAEKEAACAADVESMNQERIKHEAEMAKMRASLEKEFAEKRQDFERKTEAFCDEKRRFDDELKKMAEIHSIQDSRVKLDVGGHSFTSSMLTLTKDPDSMLCAMFSGRHELKREPDGSYFIDRDGTHFRYILNYLRDGGLNEASLPRQEATLAELMTEAEYYQLSGLTATLQTFLPQINK